MLQIQDTEQKPLHTGFGATTTAAVVAVEVRIP
jgi:hypothetical protein